MEKLQTPWFGAHVLMQRGSADAQALTAAVPALRRVGINTLVAEINYNYAFESHPELRDDQTAAKADVRALREACRAEGVRLIPQFQCIGHQSWAKHTFPLLTRYPQYDETPGQFPDNEGIYCRSWCPRHPEVNPIIFDLFEELVEAFDADALHVGLDEIFLIGSEHCPRCRGADTGEIFAAAVNDYHEILVGKYGLQMLMWADRLLNAEQTGYGLWEAAENGTDTAIDRVPRDIVMCDWHYEMLPAYPSIEILTKAGFAVWPGGWRVVENTQALIAAARPFWGKGVIGHLCTTWGAVQPGDLATWPPVLKAEENLKNW